MPDAPSFRINPLYISEDSGSLTNRSIVDLLVDLPEPAFPICHQTQFGFLKRGSWHICPVGYLLLMGGALRNSRFNDKK